MRSAAQITQDVTLHPPYPFPPARIDHAGAVLRNDLLYKSRLKLFVGHGDILRLVLRLARPKAARLGPRSRPQP